MTARRLLGPIVAARKASWVALCACALVTRAAAGDTPAVPGGSLGDRIGVKRGVALTHAPSKADRVRGLTRLGASMSPRAVERLVDSLEPGGSASSPEERLTAVRALASHTDDPDVRRALARVVGGHETNLGTAERSPLDDWTEETAALALARSGTTEAVAALGRELVSTGRAAKAATNALVAYPPRDLSPLLSATRLASETLVHALDALGDQRAFDRLRELVRTGTVETRAEAAVALTRLGDYETVAVARRWARASNPDALRIAAARILGLANAKGAGAGAVIAALLEAPSTARDALALALEFPSRTAVPDLLRLLDATNDEGAPLLIEALGRAGGQEATRRLATLVSHPTRGAWAIDALARMKGPEPSAAMTRAFETHTFERPMALAAAVRYLETREFVPGFGGAIGRLLRSKDPADRAAGAAAYSAIDPRRIASFLDSKDAAVVVSAAALLPLATAETAHRAALRLSHERDPEVRAALATALVFDSAAAAVSRATLLAFVDDGSAAAPLAARALAERDDAEHEADTNALLADPDPWIRGHAALGLGQSRLPDATGRLADAYRFEPDETVRAAIVCALSERDDEARTPTLALAESLDSSSAVRALALRALHGERLTDVTGGPAAAVVTAVGQVKEPEHVEVGVRAPGGLALPVSTGPGGIGIVAGLPRGPWMVRVAPREKPDDDSTRGDLGNPKSDRIDGH